MKKRTLLATLVAVGGIVLSTGVSLALYKKVGTAQDMKISTQTISKKGDLNYTIGDAVKVDDATNFATPLSPNNKEHKMSFALGAYRGDDATVAEQPYTLGRATVEVDFKTKAFKDACTASVTATGYEGTYYAQDANKGKLVAGVDETASTESKTVFKNWYTINTQHTQATATTQALLVDLKFDITDDNMKSLAESSYTVKVTWQDQSTSSDEYDRPYIVSTQGWDRNREFAMYQNIGKTDGFEWMYKGFKDDNDNPEAKVRMMMGDPKTDTWIPSEGNIPLSKGVSYDVYWNGNASNRPEFYDTFKVVFDTGVTAPDKLYFYSFGGDPKQEIEEWPGKEMTKHTDGSFTYMVEVGNKDKYQTIIFNNGKDGDEKTQTEDIVVNGVRAFKITGITPKTESKPNIYTYVAL